MPIDTAANRLDHDRLAKLIRSIALALGLGLLVVQVSIVGLILVVWTGTKDLNAGNQGRAEVTRAQIACFNKVQGNYMARLGALAETGNRQMLGEPPNAEDTRKAVIALQEADLLLRRVEDICYTADPDETPLDGNPN